MPEPSYLAAYESGLLKERIDAAWARMAECDLCPRQCGVDRTGRLEEAGLGFCRTGEKPVVSSYNAHFGEESPLVGERGSGTIFFTHCNLKCAFCQNDDISLLGRGQEISIDDLAAIMLHLKSQGCHNINFVTPTHQTAHILAALPAAIEGGLDLPLVYNCGGYESVETLKLLDGIVDIYMPDLKFADPKVAARVCAAPDYFERAKAAVREMHRQVGDLILDENGLAVRGLIVRHLVLPNDQAGTKAVVEFLAGLSKDTYLNVMAQYRPCGRAPEMEGFDRRITPDEHAAAVTQAALAGLTRLDKPRLGRLLRFLL